jgi:Flp pilus assembly protein protease CpaA
MHAFPASLAAFGLLIACVTDLRTGKIPNELTFSLMAVGLVMNAALGDPLLGVLGFVVATAIHFPLFALGVEKGGDAKLLMGLGALGGWPLLVETTGWYAIVYLPVGLTVLAVSGQLPNLKHKALWLYQRALAKQNGTEFKGEEPPNTMLKTAPVIATAWVLAYLTPWLERVLS